MKKEANNLLEQQLSLIQGMEELGTDPYFYTRLRARMMDQEQTGSGWELPLKPVWVIGLLLLLLAGNGLLLKQSSQSVKTNTAQGIQALAASYDQVVSD